MNRPPVWIERAALLLLHEESLALFGGASGMRDDGLLDSALARPVNQQLYESASDIATLAAAYGYGLAKNHPFIDGNKRAAFLAIGLFLAANGKRLGATQLDAIHTMLGVAGGRISEAILADWIRGHLRPR